MYMYVYLYMHVNTHIHIYTQREKKMDKNVNRQVCGFICIENFRKNIRNY
jgi:hypothetical protein